MKEEISITCFLYFINIDTPKEQLDRLMFEFSEISKTKEALIIRAFV